MPEGLVQFSKKTGRYESPETLAVELKRLAQVKKASAIAAAAQAADEATIKYRADTRSLMSNNEYATHQAEQARAAFAEQNRPENTPFLSPREKAVLGIKETTTATKTPEPISDVKWRSDVGTVMTEAEYKHHLGQKFTAAISTPRTPLPHQTQMVAGTAEAAKGDCYYDSEANTYVTRQPTGLPEQPRQLG